MTKQIKTGLITLLLGLIGVLSLLTVTIPLPEEVQAALLESFTPDQIKYLLLVNPSIMVVIFVLAGTAFHEQTRLSLPIITWQKPIDFTGIILFGVSGGVLAGSLITIVASLFEPFMSEVFAELQDGLELSLTARFLFGGITEEILMRYGLMTLIVWVLHKLSKGYSGWIYWTGIILSAILFGAGHLPAAASATQLTPMLIFYVLTGNALGGLIFGWLYWKKGLESAMIAHIFAHMTMLVFPSLTS